MKKAIIASILVVGLAASVTLALVALARPQWGAEVRVVEQEGVQVMVALDVSKSMLALGEHHPVTIKDNG